MFNSIDRFFGRGTYAVTVPSMDGAFRPNSELDDALTLAEAASADNAFVCDDAVYFTASRHLLKLSRGAKQAQLIDSFTADITAAASSPSGVIALALSDGLIFIRENGTRRSLAALQRARGSITAMAFRGDDCLIATVGSSIHPTTMGQADLLGQGATGSVWAIDAQADNAIQIAGGLAYPAGVLIRGESALVSEAWKHRIVRIPLAGGKAKLVVGDFPAYPGRLTDGRSGDAWLCLFAPRSQLIEFVLREKSYRNRMVREVPMQHWIAPALSSGRSFREPLQGGAVKQMGILKPWAPTRSYGLIAHLNDDFQPTQSFHSRSDGHRHGITSVAIWKESAVVTSRGGDLVLQLT